MRSLSFRWWLPAVAAAFLAPAASGAEPATVTSDGLPGWVVPVLRLVSATHVEPTTGVVVSSDGLVLVPLEFAGAGEEIVVLDGGTDIVRNGRPARLERTFPELGLKVLAVEGLQRNPARLAAAPQTGSGTVTLAALPPAEEIVEGAPPLRLSAALTVLAENATPTIAPDAALPNVTGPLLDDCGNLAGLSLAGGVQSMAPSPATRYLWHAALLAVAAQLGLPATGSPCAVAASPEEPTAEAPVDLPVPREEREETPIEVPAEQPAEPEQSAEPEQRPPPADAEEPLLPVEELPPAEPPTGPAGPSRWWLAAVLLLLAGVYGLYRLRQRGAPQAGTGLEPPPGAAPTSAAGVAAGGGAENDPGALSADLAQDHRLVLRGHYADGRRLLIAASVSAWAVNLEIGRGSADLAIDSAAVSRRHARLNGIAGALTLTDLGSNNGTSINGVPCLEGEIMYLEPGDTVILGDVRFTVELEPAAGELRAE